MASNNKLLPYLTDNNAGDGTDQGFCPYTSAGLRCLSSEECRVCKKIGDNYEGCVVTSTSPVCDSDKDAALISTTDDADKTAQCVGCKKDGKSLCGININLYKRNVGIRWYCWEFQNKLINSI